MKPLYKIFCVISIEMNPFHRYTVITIVFIQQEFSDLV